MPTKKTAAQLDREIDEVISAGKGSRSTAKQRASQAEIKIDEILDERPGEDWRYYVMTVLEDLDTEALRELEIRLLRTFTARSFFDDKWGVHRHIDSHLVAAWARDVLRERDA